MAKHIPFGQAVNHAETWAFKFLKNELPSDYLLLTNIEIPSHNGHAMEVDALVIGQWGVFIIDVKGYTGKIEVGQHVWLADGKPIDNALAKANQVGRILAGKVRREIANGDHAPWCQGMVMMTGREGEDIHLNKLDNNLSVFTPNTMTQALTQEWGSTAKYKHQISEEQRQYVLDTIGQVALVEARNHRLQDFVKSKKLYSHDGLEIWQAHLDSSQRQTHWLLKTLVGVNFSNNETYQVACEKLAKQYQRLQDLSGCSGVPQCAPLIKDGETFTLPLRRPRGVPLDLFDHAGKQPSELITLLRRAATSLQQIHNTGYSIGDWTSNQIFISNHGEVEYIDIADSSALSDDISSFCHTFSHWLDVINSPMLTLWFSAAKSGQHMSLDQLRAQLSNELAYQHSNLTSSSIRNSQLDKSYLLNKCLRQGDNSEIWSATHKLGQFPCAISIYHNINDNWLNLHQQYQRLKDFYHPNIEQFIELGQCTTNINDGIYLSRQWVSGESLLAQKGKISSHQADLWFEQLTRALEYLHSFDLWHGGISLRNIICDSQNATLVNFGLGLDAIGNKEYRNAVDQNIWRIEDPKALDRFALSASFIIALSKAELPKTISYTLLKESYQNLPKKFLTQPHRNWIEQSLSVIS